MTIALEIFMMVWMILLTGMVVIALVLIRHHDSAHSEVGSLPTPRSPVGRVYATTTGGKFIIREKLKPKICDDEAAWRLEQKNK